MKRPIGITAAALAVGLALTGCSSSNADQEAVSKLALKSAAKYAYGDKESVVGSWTWRDGWAVLVKGVGKNNDGPYVNWQAYAFAPDGGSWKQSQSELVESSSAPDKTPHKATCLTLAQTDAEVRSCGDLSD
jgi:hypothetical protein